VVNQTLAFQIKFCCKSPTLRVAAKPLCFIKDEPTAHLAHLVFASTLANPKKPKELNFATACLKKKEYEKKNKHI